MVSVFLTWLGVSLYVSRYILLVPAALLEGISASIVAGSLVHVGILDFWPAYICLITGKLIGDVIWYWVGYHVGEPFVTRIGGRFGLTDKDIKVAKKVFHKHQDVVLFFSKLTMGLGLAIVILFTAGLTRISFARYMFFNALGEALWTGVLLILGIYFGALLLSTSDAFQRGLIVMMYIGGFVGLTFLARYVRKRILEARYTGDEIDEN